MAKYKIDQYNAKKDKWLDMGVWNEEYAKGEFIKGYTFDGEFYKKGNSQTMYKLTEIKENEKTLESIIENPTLEFEISNCDATLDEIIEAAEKAYSDFKFSRTEKRYDTCIVAVFERK